MHFTTGTMGNCVAELRIMRSNELIDGGEANRRREKRKKLEEETADEIPTSAQYFEIRYNREISRLSAISRVGLIDYPRMISKF